MQCFITFPNNKKRIENTKHSTSKYFYDLVRNFLFENLMKSAPWHVFPNPK